PVPAFHRSRRPPGSPPLPYTTLFRSHLGIREDSGSVPEPGELSLPRGHHPLPDPRTGLRGCCAPQVRRLDRRHVHVEVDTVQERPGDARTVPLDLPEMTHAPALAIPMMPTRARIHRGHEHEPRRVLDR